MRVRRRQSGGTGFPDENERGAAKWRRRHAGIPRDGQSGGKLGQRLLRGLLDVSHAVFLPGAADTRNVLYGLRNRLRVQDGGFGARRLEYPDRDGRLRVFRPADHRRTDHRVCG